MATKPKVAASKEVTPAPPAPQGDGEWGPTANQPPAALGDAAATNAKTDGQSQEQAATATQKPDAPPAPPAPQGDGEGDEGDEPAAEASGADEFEAATPDTFADSLKELSRIQALPERTGTQAKRKEAALLKIQKHVHEIQQGTPVPNISALNMKHFEATTNHAEAVQLDNLRRQFPIVDRLARKCERLEKQLAEKK
jgi:hypothetical protein